MKKSLLYLSLLFGLPFASCAQQPTEFQVNGTIEGDGLKNPTFFIRSMDNPDTKAATNLKIEGNTFTGKVGASKDGFYQFYGVNNRVQIIVPVYYPKADKQLDIQLQMVNGCPQVNTDANNRALSAFNTLTYTRGRSLWMDGPKMNSDQLFELINGYNVAVDSIVKATKCDQPVQQYLRLWAYNLVANSYLNLSRILGTGQTVSFKLSDLQPEPSKVLDSPMTAYFPASAHLIIGALPKGSLAERLAALHQQYTCQEVYNLVDGSLVANFIREFNFDRDFEAGVQQLTALTEQYKLDPSYLKEFKLRKSSAKGSPFPEGINLVDVNGNKVDFSSFKGYYVYIDMWASWCGPCCKEAPHLQELEKKLQNKNVKFVSISIDKKEAAWKKKMQELGLHGHQLLNQDNQLAEALNVKGIPMFLIYDKEGKLYMYNAPRPSNGEGLRMLLEGLK